MNAYHYTECGLSSVYLVNGRPALAFEDIDGLHSAIGKLLVQKSRTLDGAEIRFLRKEMNRSQTALGDHLGVSCKTIWRWEKNAARIHQAKDLLLRRTYLAFLDCPCPESALARLMNDDRLANGAESMFLEKVHGDWQLLGQN